MKRFLLLSIAILVLVASLLTWWWHRSLMRPADQSDIDLEISPGASQTSVLKQLEGIGLMP